MKAKKAAGKFLRFFALLLAVIVVLGFFALYQTKESVQYTLPPLNVTIAVSKTPLSAPFYIAKEQGFFAEEGLQVEFLGMAGGHRCLQAVLDKKADMGTTSDLPIMFNSLQGRDFVITATFVTSTNDLKIMTNKSNGVGSPADLKGTRVAVTPGSASQFFLDFFLLNHGLSSDDLQIVALQPEKMAEALFRGEVDAVSIWEPFGYKAHEMLGDDLLVMSHDQLYRETFNLVVDRDFHNSNPEVVERVLRGLLKSIDFIKTNETKAQAIIIEELETEKEFIDWIWKDFNYQLILDQGLIDTLEDEAQWAVDSGIANKDQLPDLLSLFDTAPVKKVNPVGITLMY